MLSRLARGGSVVLLGLSVALTFAPVPASAHIRMTAPTPRNDSDSMKDGPCGTQPKGAPQIEYTQGQEIKVDLDETIDHTGCFQVAISSDDEATWQILGQKVDPEDGPINRQVGEPRDITVTLPPGVTCESCTISLRQIMLEGQANKTCAPNQDVNVAPAAGNTYFSCADVKISASGDAGLPSSSSGGSSGGPATSSSSGAAASSSGGAAAAPGAAGSGAPSPGSSGRGGYDAPEEGCNTAPGGTGSALGLVAVLGYALCRRRRAAPRQL